MSAVGDVEIYMEWPEDIIIDMAEIAEELFVWETPFVLANRDYAALNSKVEMMISFYNNIDE